MKNSGWSIFAEVKKKNEKMKNKNSTLSEQLQNQIKKMVETEEKYIQQGPIYLTNHLSGLVQALQSEVTEIN